MKKIYAIALSVLPLLSFGQFSTEWHSVQEKEGQPGDDIGFDYTLTNTNQNDSISISWVFTHDLANSTDDWEDYMCEGLFICWPAFVRENTFKLGPGQAIDMYHHILTYQDGDTGTWVSTAFIWQEGDSANTVQEMVVTAKITEPDTPDGINDLDATAGMLKQNAPNPFKGSTVIPFQLNGDQGALKVQDLTGKLVMEIPLNKRSGELTLRGQLDAGIYFYSLWEQGRMIDSKRMQVID